MLKLKIISILFLGVFIAATIYAIFEAQDTATSLAGIFILAILCGLEFLIIYFGIGKYWKCPHCKKRFAIKKINKERVGREDISILMETKNRNYRGDIIGTSEQYIPGKRIKYRINYVCRKCGKKTHKMKYKDYPKV